MWEAIILGALQGITEWLPISSEGVSVLAQVHLFGQASVASAISLALYLHLGTMLAALVYFRKDVWKMILSLRPGGSQPDRTLLLFVAISTLVSAPIAYGLLIGIEQAEEMFALSGSLATGIIALLLFITGFLLLRTHQVKTRSIADSRWYDGAIAGLVQGLAVLPGFSRSGLTVAALLLRKFSGAAALKMSFLMSIPLVLGGGIALQIREATFSTPELIGALVAFVIGLGTIHLLLRIAHRINFGAFVLFFAVLTLISAFI